MAVRVIAKDRHHALQQARGAARAEQLDRAYANQRLALWQGTALIQQMPDADHHLAIVRLRGPFLSEQEIAEYPTDHFCPRRYAESHIIYDPLEPDWDNTPRFANEVRPFWDWVHPWYGQSL